MLAKNVEYGLIRLLNEYICDYNRYKMNSNEANSFSNNQMQATIISFMYIIIIKLFTIESF